MRVILSWHKQWVLYSISSLLSLSRCLSFLTVFSRDIKKKDVRTCPHKNQTRDRGNFLTGGEKMLLQGLHREAGESVPCIRGLMRGDLPDQRVRKAASNKAPSDSPYQCDSSNTRLAHFYYWETPQKLLLVERLTHRACIYVHYSIWKLISIKYWRDNK